MTEKKRFPAALWLLPLFFGLVGGIIAALISNLKYEASWIELFMVGLILQIGLALLWFLLVGGLYAFF